MKTLRLTPIREHLAGQLAIYRKWFPDVDITKVVILIRPEEYQTFATDGESKLLLAESFCHLQGIPVRAGTTTELMMDGQPLRSLIRLKHNPVYADRQSA